MGLPGFSIPHSYYPFIKQSLEIASLFIEELPVRDDDRAIGVMSLFRCTGDNGEVVLVSVQKAPSIPPDGIIAILRPASSRLLLIAAENRLLQSIKQQLESDGAIPPRQLRLLQKAKKKRGNEG